MDSAARDKALKFCPTILCLNHIILRKKLYEFAQAEMDALIQSLGFEEDRALGDKRAIPW